MSVVYFFCFYLSLSHSHSRCLCAVKCFSDKLYIDSIFHFECEWVFPFNSSTEYDAALQVIWVMQKFQVAKQPLNDNSLKLNSLDFSFYFAFKTFSAFIGLKRWHFSFIKYCKADILIRKYAWHHLYTRRVYNHFSLFKIIFQKREKVQRGHNVAMYISWTRT